MSPRHIDGSSHMIGISTHVHLYDTEEPIKDSTSLLIPSKSKEFQVVCKSRLKAHFEYFWETTLNPDIFYVIQEIRRIFSCRIRDRPYRRDSTHLSDSSAYI